jgi:hypothetical protein
LETQIGDEQVALYSGSTLTQAQDLFKSVKNKCPRSAEAMYSYINFTIGQKDFGSDPNHKSLTVSHWNTLFTYEGLATPNASAAVLGTTGGSGIINLTSGGELLTFDGLAGIKVPAQNSLSGSRLFTIEPVGTNCLTTNLSQYQDTCYDFNIYTSVTSFSPDVTFGICFSGVDPADLHPDPTANLGHQHGSTFKVLARVTYPPLCPESSHSASTQSNAVSRFFASLARVFGPSVAYAGHGGLGGEDGSASPLQGVNSQTFQDEFSDDILGTSPDLPPRGTWPTIISQSPGFIQVQASLGNLTDKPVVLNQGGGACSKSCGLLQITGSVFNESGSSANAGSYSITFDALEDKPTPKDAPFVVRASDGTEIVRVSYRNVSGKRLLYFNGKSSGVNWVVDAKQAFEVIVDLTGQSASVLVDGVSIGSVTFHASDLLTFGWELSGIDAGIIGWDNIEVRRRPDN